MSAGPADAVLESEAGAPKLADSAVVIGAASLGEGSLLAQGAIVRSFGAGVEVGTGSAVLENSVVVGATTMPGIWVVVGDLTVRDLTRPVTFEVDFDGANALPGGEERIAFSAATEVDRDAPARMRHSQTGAHHDDDDHRPRRLQGARTVLSHHREGPRWHC